MTADNSRRQRGAASTTTQVSSSSAGGDPGGIPESLVRWLTELVSELRGAIEDHRKWTDSDRARSLGNAFVVVGRFLTYAAYLVLAYQTFDSYVDADRGIAAGHYAIPVQTEGTRVALFNVLATGLVGPIAIIAIGFGTGWLYNLTNAAANRVLPRFVRPLVHPSIMFVVVTMFAAYHVPITATLARGYLTAKANIEAASPQEAVSIKVIEIPGPDIPDVPDVSEHEPAREHELVRLRSMFANRPCPTESQSTEMNPDAEVALPEPGLAQSPECKAEKKPVPE